MRFSYRSWLPSSIVVAYAAGYANPHTSDHDEIAALTNDWWAPSSEDFSRIADQSSSGVVWAVDSIFDLHTGLFGTPERSIGQLFLLGHSGLNMFSFSGRIGSEMRNHRRGPLVTFDTESAITKDNLDRVRSRIDRVKNRFAPGAEIILVGCHSASCCALDTSATGSELPSAVSDVFGVCVRGFKHDVCVILAHRLDHITARGGLRYDPTGRRTCRQLASPPFLNLNQLTPDAGSNCGMGVASSHEAETSLYGEKLLYY